MTSRPPDPPTCAPDSIWEATLAPYYFPTLLVADEIGLFAYLNKNPATVRAVAGFIDVRVIHTYSIFSLVSARKP